MKILLADLLYNNNGSFDEDFSSLNDLLSDDFKISYFKTKDKFFIVSILKLIWISIINKYDRVVLLSFKTPFLLFPYFLFSKKFRFIIHFVPKTKKTLHEICIKISLYLGVKIGFYSKYLNNKFKTNNSHFLLARNIDLKESNKLFEHKNKSKKINIFIPKINNVTRMSFDINKILREIDVNGFTVDRIITQNKNVYNKLKRKNLNVENKDYMNIYE